MDIPQDKEIKGTANLVSGGPIVVFKWTIDNVIQNNNTNTLTIPPNTLHIGNHTIKFQGQNYCGNFSTELVENINITEVKMAYTQTDIVNVVAPATDAQIKLRRVPTTATVTLTVVDEQDKPFLGAIVKIGTITGTTNTTGVAVLLAVPTGAQTVTTSLP